MDLFIVENLTPARLTSEEATAGRVTVNAG